MDKFKYSDPKVQKHYEAWFRWYHYEGGKELTEQKELKEKRQELIAKENLEATTPMAEVWLLSEGTFDAYLDMQFQSLIYQSLMDEWGPDSEIIFNHSSVIFKNGSKEKVVANE